MTEKQAGIAAEKPAVRAAEREWPMWEVFIRSQHGLAHKHVGSLHAANGDSALQHARDVYTRRNEGVSIWVVAASNVVASSPDDKAALFDPAQSKVFRHRSEERRVGKEC